MAHEHDPFDPAADPILSWAAGKGLVGTNGRSTAAAAVATAERRPVVGLVERPKAEGVKEQLEIRLQQLGVDLRRTVPSATLDRLAVELGTTPKSLNSALQRIRRAKGISLKPHAPETTERRKRERQEPAAAQAPAEGPTPPATSDPTQQARALAVQIAGDLYLLADGQDRDLLLMAGRLVEGLLR